MIRALSIILVFFMVALTGCGAEWHLRVENATKAELQDVSVSWDKHRITFGILGYDTRWRVDKTHLYVSDVVGGRVPTNAVVQYTTADTKVHKISVAVPKSVTIGSKDTLVFSVGDDEKISVRKDK